MSKLLIDPIDISSLLEGKALIENITNQLCFLELTDEIIDVVVQNIITIQKLDILINKLKGNTNE